MRVIVADIGGTKVNFARARAGAAGARVELAQLRSYASADFDSFAAILRRYLDEQPGPASGASFAVAGPVHDQRCAATNLPWVIDAASLAADFELSRVRLLNDLEALAWAVPSLHPDQLLTLHPGGAGVGNACVIAAGTGLGEAGLLWDGARHIPFASEGGHASFAPCSERERELLAYLAARHEHVSWERVVSGMGVANIYAFLRERHGAPGMPAWWEEARAAGREVARIAELAADGECAICVETMAMFATLLGREAGNAALKYMALGGVYLAGGVAQRNRSLLEGGQFLAGFLAKGRMRALVERMPVHLITEPEAALEGAYYALAASEPGRARSLTRASRAQL